MKNKCEKRIYRDKNGGEFTKESYFLGGKMKFRKVYVINGIPADEYYEKNAPDVDFYLNGDYDLINREKDLTTISKEPDSLDKENL